MTDVIVTQEDREAAATIYQRFRDHDYAAWVSAGTNATGDADFVIRAFAQHRIKAALAMQERAANTIAGPGGTYEWLANRIRNLEVPE